MKEIKLKISDMVYEKIKQHMIAKKLVDNIIGIIDSFIILLVRSIEANEKEVEIKLKEEKDE